MTNPITLRRNNDPYTSHESANKVEATQMEKIVWEVIDSFGVKFRLEDDGISINGLGKTGTFKAAKIDSCGDHRIAMASSIGSLRSDGESSVLDCLNVNTSFPNFIEVCKEVGINIQEA